MKLYDNPYLKDLDSHPLEATIYSKVKGDKSFEGVDAKEVFHLKFNEVEKIKDAFNNLTDDNINFIFKTIWGKEINHNKVRALEFYRAFNYVVKEVEDIYKLEEKLGRKPNQKLINAGIKKMSIFGSLNLIDDVAQKYHFRPKDVEEWNYSEVYWYALKIKTENEIQKNLSNEK